MQTRIPALVLLASLAASPAVGQQEETFDYWQYNREMIQRGVQAILLCNGLFTSNRTLDQVFEQELAYLRDPIGTPE
ncbi:MAG: serine hydrolase, partial [Gemmatimonadetes bacterium]|nr:serine hydrolase [Gemmatimonadota bacterium]